MKTSKPLVRRGACRARRRSATALLRASCLLVGLLLPLAGCGSGSGSGSSDPRPSPALAAFAPFRNQILGLFTVAAVGMDESPAPGARLQLDATNQRLLVEFLHPDQGVVAGPFALTQVASAPDTFAVAGVNGFGLSGLTLRARVREDASGQREVSLQILQPGRRDPGRVVLTPPPGMQQLLEAFRDYYYSLSQDPPFDALDRFAETVQTVVDTCAARFGYLGNDVVVTIILEALGDLFLPADYKQELLAGPPYLNSTIGDPILTGFKPHLQRGEGRFRHFTANALAIGLDLTGGLLVNLAARIVGGDWEFLEDRDGDIAADLETNAIGRDFGRLLEQMAEDGTLNDGVTVKRFLHDRFGERSADSRPPYPPATQPVNHAPRLILLENTFLPDAHANLFAVLAEDEDGDTLTYTWSWHGPASECGQDQGPGPGGEATRIYYHGECSAALEAQTYVTVTVSDGKGGVVSHTLGLRDEGSFDLTGQ